MGYEAAFFYFGIGQGIVVMVVSLLLRAPRPGETPEARAKVQQTTRDYEWWEMIQSPVLR